MKSVLMLMKSSARILPCRKEWFHQSLTVNGSCWWSDGRLARAGGAGDAQNFTIGAGEVVPDDRAVPSFARARQTWRQGSGLSQYEGRIKQVFDSGCWWFVALHLVQQRFEGEFCQLALRHLHSCERRNHELRQSHIIESHNGKLLRNRPAEVVGFAHYADCGHVVGTHNRSRAGWQLRQVFQCADSAFHSVIAFEN